MRGAPGIGRRGRPILALNRPSLLVPRPCPALAQHVVQMLSGNLLAVPALTPVGRRLARRVGPSEAGTALVEGEQTCHVPDVAVPPPAAEAGGAAGRDRART